MPRLPAVEVKTERSGLKVILDNIGRLGYLSFINKGELIFIYANK